MQRWDEVEDALLGDATDDLVACREVSPSLVAYAGDEPLLKAFLRPFPKGGYHQPLTELFALAAPLGASRLALSMGGRAWSLKDPMPPVLPGVGDLRQRVLILTTADATGKPTRVRGRMFPFEVGADGVRWRDPVGEDAPVGWIPETMAIAVEVRTRMRADPATIREQAERCVHLGHWLAFSPPVHERLGFDRDLPLADC